MKVSKYQAHKMRWAEGCGAGECDLAGKRCFARGDVPCDVAFLGESPGPSENALGKPFVGPAGHLLDYIVEQAVPEGVRCGFANLVACMPRDDDGRKALNPSDEQVLACQPRLVELVKILDPRLIVCVGKLAEDWTDPKYRHGAKFHRAIPRISITHPAAILRATVAVKDLLVQRAINNIAAAVEEHVTDE